MNSLKQGKSEKVLSILYAIRHLLILKKFDLKQRLAKQCDSVHAMASTCF